jgi:hypothetical protein
MNKTELGRMGKASACPSKNGRLNQWVRVVRWACDEIWARVALPERWARFALPILREGA